MPATATVGSTSLQIHIGLENLQVCWCKGAITLIISVVLTRVHDDQLTNYVVSSSSPPSYFSLLATMFHYGSPHLFHLIACLYLPTTHGLRSRAGTNPDRLLTGTVIDALGPEPQHIMKEIYVKLFQSIDEDKVGLSYLVQLWRWLELSQERML